MATPTPAVKKTAIATLNSNLAYSIERLNNSEVAVGLASDGTFVPFTGTNYINDATSIKDSVIILDGSIQSISDSRYTKDEVDAKFSALIGGADSALDTLKELADALDNDASAKVTLSNQLNTESLRAIAAEEVLTADLATEVQRATDAETELAADLSAEVTRATGVESALTTSLNQEISRSTTADASQTTAIETEVANRISAVTNLQASLESTVTTNYNTLDAAITAEVGRATGAEGVLTTNLNAEVVRATAAENSLTTDLASEVTRATGVETQLIADLGAEVIRAGDAEEALDIRLVAVEDSYIHKNGSVAFTGNLNMDNHKITTVATPTLAQDAANKAYVDSKITSLGSVFEYVGTVDGGDDLDALNASHAGVYYRVVSSGTVTFTGGSLNVNVGDGVVYNKSGTWDKIDNTDANVDGTSGRITVTGDADNGYYVNIASTYVGQASINTVGTITTGTWQGSVVDVPYGGTSFSSYTQGDLLIGNSSSGLSKLAVGADNTILRSDGTDASWVVADTQHVALTDNTNFNGLLNLQQSLDFLYNNTQIRKFAQHEIVNSSVLTAANAALTSGKFQAGKVIFVNYESGSPKIYLPKSTVNVVDGSVFRIVHNGAYTDGNLTIAYVDSSDVEHVILELAPKDSISCVWNASEQMYMFAVGI